MMRSLFSGVTGMQNHQTRMDVIGNNVANVNTTGFKRGRVNFQDLISQQLSGAARPTEELGGVNPKEVGLGMMVASIDTIFTQGALQTTGVNTDLAIQGNGFFILKDGEKTFYTRAGAFGIDKEGALKGEENGKKNGQITNEQTYKKAQNAVKANATYAKELVEKQQLSEVDAISGATISYEQFAEAAQKAIEEAKK